MYGIYFLVQYWIRVKEWSRAGAQVAREPLPHARRNVRPERATGMTPVVLEGNRRAPGSAARKTGAQARTVRRPRAEPLGPAQSRVGPSCDYLQRQEIDTVVPAPAPPPTSVEILSPWANAAVFTRSVHDVFAVVTGSEQVMPVGNPSFSSV